MPKQLALVLSLTLASAAAQARDCGDGPTQTDMNICFGAAFKKADAEMNARYRKIVACMKDDAAPLIAAQRDWLAFRDAECRFQDAASAGGTIQPMVLAICATSLTQQRNKELVYYLTCQEGDASCPTYACDFHEGGAPEK